MGSYISIGFVYDDCENKEKVVNSILNSFVKKISSVSYKYSKDLYGEKWIEKELDTLVITQDILIKLISNYYAQIDIEGIFVINGIKKVIIRIEKNTSYWGILIDLREEEVKKASYIKVEKQIIEYLIKIYKHINY